MLKSSLPHTPQEYVCENSQTWTL